MSRPLGMIAIVSAQTWPNLLGLLHFQQKTGETVRVLYLYHSDEENVSLGPARRFRDWCLRQFPAMEVRLSGEEGQTGMCPEDVAATVKNWIATEPDWDWVVNLTGGTKLMTCGLSDLIGSSGDHVRFIYREIGGVDYELTRNVAGQIVSQTFPMAPDLADDLDIELLAELQQGDKWMPQRARPLPILKLVEAGLENYWHWSAAFDACEVKTDQDRGNGRLFEEFVAAVLLKMGVRQVAINLKTGVKGQHKSEVDVACLYRNQLHLFDCKLPLIEQLSGESNVALVTEINDTANRLRARGGLGSRGYLLRPSRNYDEPLKRLAERFGCEVWDRAVMTRFFDALGEKLAIPAQQWGGDLQRANEWMKKNIAPDGEAFCCSALAAITESGEFPVLNTLLSKWAANGGHPTWSGYVNADGALVLHLGFTEKGHCETRTRQLQELFSFLDVKGACYDVRAAKATLTLPGIKGPQRQTIYKMLKSGALESVN